MISPLLRSVAAASIALALLGCESPPEQADDRSSEPVTPHPGLPANPVREVMQDKLELSGRVLRGIAIGDHRMVADSAEELALLSELSEWQVHDTAAYTAFSRQFQAHARELALAAREGREDALERSYLQLTETCIRCHAYLREEGLVREMPGQVAGGRGGAGGLGG